MEENKDYDVNEEPIVTILLPVDDKINKENDIEWGPMVKIGRFTNITSTKDKKFVDKIK